jgi:hypothetical protein
LTTVIHSCTAAQDDILFHFAFSVLPPARLHVQVEPVLRRRCLDSHLPQRALADPYAPRMVREQQQQQQRRQQQYNFFFMATLTNNRRTSQSASRQTDRQIDVWQD